MYLHRDGSNESNFIPIMAQSTWHVIFGICRVVVFGFRMSLDECLGREIDHMGKAPKPDVKFNT